MRSQYESIRWNRYDEFKTHKIPRWNCPNATETNHPEWWLPISPTRAQFLVFGDSVRLSADNSVQSSSTTRRPHHPLCSCPPISVSDDNVFILSTVAYRVVVSVMRLLNCAPRMSKIMMPCSERNKPSLNKHFVRFPFRNVSRILRQTKILITLAVDRIRIIW